LVASSIPFPVQKIVMKTCPKMDPDGGCDPFITIEQNGKVKETAQGVEKTGSRNKLLSFFLWDI
jgi:hypothetical protein